MAIDEVHNYYEDLVSNYIDALELSKNRSEDYIADLYCLALNQLPCHYIRYGVDMIFYTSDEKRREMEDRVVFAVTSAVNWLEKERLEHQEEEKTRSAEKQAEQAAKQEQIRKDAERTALLARDIVKRVSGDVSGAARRDEKAHPDRSRTTAKGKKDRQRQVSKVC